MTDAQIDALRAGDRVSWGESGGTQNGLPGSVQFSGYVAFVGRLFEQGRSLRVEIAVTRCDDPSLLAARGGNRNFLRSRLSQDDVIFDGRS